MTTLVQISCGRAAMLAPHNSSHADVYYLMMEGNLPAPSVGLYCSPISILFSG